MQVDFTEIVVAAVSLMFSAIIIPLVRAAFLWLRTRTRSEALECALGEAEMVADSVVASLQANVVDGLKQRTEDGKLSLDDASEIADMAIDMFISDISAKSLEAIEQNADDIVAYIGNLIEARLFRAKK